jgi:hypothetical protein
MRKEEAYKILGLKNGAPRIEVEKRYSVYLRKMKSAMRSQETDKAQDIDADFDFDEITEAYNLLMGYTNEEEVEAQKIPQKTNPVLKKLGIDEDKLKNNLYYFRFHIIIGIILIITIALSIRSCVTRIDPNLNMVFMGNLYCNNTEKLQEDMVNMIPEVVAVGIENLYMSAQQERQDPQMQMAMMQKAMVLVAAGEIDIFVLDKANFELYAKQGGFRKLDDLVAQLSIPEEKQYKFKVEDEDEKDYVYGIDVLNSKIFKDADVSGEQLIVAISVNGKNYDNAIKCLELLLKE